MYDHSHLPPEIVLDDDPKLREPSEPVEPDASVAHLARRLAMLVAWFDGHIVGLAAPQIGIQKRVFVFLNDDGDVVPAVNPKVSVSSDFTATDRESCLSIPGIYVMVERPFEIEAEWQSIHGEDIKETLKGFTARVFQHELDHLDGVLITDHGEAHDITDE